MRTIKSKKEVVAIAQTALEQYVTNGNAACSAWIIRELLSAKIKFPLLEIAARLLYPGIRQEDQIAVCDQIIAAKTIGGNVVAAILLQCRLSDNFEESLAKAQAYFVDGNEWYCCDIIGERVMGYALLTWPEKTLPIMEQLSQSPINWVVRSIGVGGHYAVKKGLSAPHTAALFRILLSLSDRTERHTQTGIGWAAKTVAKFHPALIREMEAEIKNKTGARSWFHHKIAIGLKINAYRNSRKIDIK